eukprot:716901-Prymnesium_polylepis.1
MVAADAQLGVRVALAGNVGVDQPPRAAHNEANARGAQLAPGPVGQGSQKPPDRRLHFALWRILRGAHLPSVLSIRRG